MRLIALLILLGSPALVAGQSAEAAVRAVLDEQVRAWNQGDLSAFVKTYSAETLFVGKEVTRGNAGVLERYKRNYPTREKMGTLQFSDIEVRLLGRDFASVLGRFHLDAHSRRRWLRARNLHLAAKTFGQNLDHHSRSHQLIYRVVELHLLTPGYDRFSWLQPSSWRRRFLLLRTRIPFRRGSLLSCPGSQQLTDLISLTKPVGDWRLNLVPMREPEEVHQLGFRRRFDAPHLRSLQRAAQEYTDLEKLPIRAHEKVAGFAREHDRFVGSVYTLFSERCSGFAQAFVRVSKIVGKVSRESLLGCCPAVMSVARLDPLLAVVALIAIHDLL